MAASGSPKPLLRSRGSEGRNSAPSASAINGREIEIEIEQIRARLVANEVERRELEAVLSDLLSRRPGKSAEIRQANPVMDATIVTTASSGAEKIALFRRLFIGRSAGKIRRPPSPAMHQQRERGVRGICGKPRVKCGECPRQAFIPVTDEIIEKPSARRRHFTHFCW